MLEQVTVLAVHGYEVARPRQLDHLLEIILARVARDVDEGDVLPEHLGAPAEERVDGPADHALVAGDDARGENHEIARADLDVLVLPRRDQRYRRVGLALAARGQDDLLPRLEAAQLLEGDQESLRYLEVAHLRGDGDIGDHAASEQGDLPPAGLRQVQHLLYAVNMRGEGGDEDAARRLGEAALERFTDLGLRPGAPGAADIGRIRAEAEHPALAEGGEFRVVGLLGVHGTRVELEVAGMDDRAHRRLDGEPDAVGDGMGDADRDDDEAARPDLVARRVGPQVRALESAELAQAMPGYRERQRRAIHRHVELPQEVGERADMVLVAVGQHHGPEALPVLAEVGEVRDDIVHPRHLVVGEEEPAIDRDDVVARLDQHHVEADLAETPQRDQADDGLGGDVDRDRLGSVKGAHGGAVIVSPRRAPTKKRPGGRSVLGRVGELGKLRERKRLGPAAGIDARGGAHRPRALGGKAQARGEGIGEALPALAERREDDRAQSRRIAHGHRRHPPHAKVDHRGVHLGRWAKGPGRDREGKPRLAGELGQHGQAPVGLAPGTSRDALGDFLLEHERHLVEDRPRLDEGLEDGLAHAVREIAHDDDAPGRVGLEGGQPRVVKGARVGQEDLDVGRIREALAERRGHDLVHLEGEEPAGRAGEAARQRSQPRPDLDHEILLRRLDEADHPLGHGVVAEEVLAERPRLSGGGMTLGPRRQSPRVPARAHARRRAASSARSAPWTARTWRSVSSRVPELSMT